MKYVFSVIERNQKVNIDRITAISFQDTEEDRFIKFDEIIWRGYASKDDFEIDKTALLDAMKW